MPRHITRFQRAFFHWFKANHTRFSIYVSLKPLKGARVKIEFANHPESLRITANASTLGVWAYWNGEPWDRLLDLDVIPVKMRDGVGFSCRLCQDQTITWSTLEELWANHLFDPFLKWVNKDFANAKTLRLFGECKSTTWANLSSYSLPDDSESFFADIPLQVCHQPTPDFGKNIPSLEEQYQMVGGEEQSGVSFEEFEASVRMVESARPFGHIRGWLWFHGKSYEILSGRMRAGEYPGALDRDFCKGKLDYLLSQGINAFLDLTERGELRAYQSELIELAGQRNLAFVYKRMAIRDLSIPESPQHMTEILDQIDQWLLEGRSIYVHCWGGVGRTGTVVGCHLLRMGYSGDAALEQLGTFWQLMNDDKRKRHPRSPEIDEQREYVRQGATLFGATP